MLARRNPDIAVRFGTGRLRHRDDLLRQAAIARALGSPFVGAVLEATRRQLDHAPRLAERIDFWPGDFAADAVAMRLNAGLNALARRDAPPVLGRLYRERDGNFDSAIAAALASGEDELVQWLDWPTQTNEVGRSSAFIAALAVVAARDPRPVELLEIGASAGLNLNLARYAHMLGGRVLGDAASPLVIRPDWQGPPPPPAFVHIHEARGVDLRPIDLADPAARERMMAFVWADRDDRAARLAGAFAVAAAHPPRVEQGSALEWLPAQLARPQAAGVRRVIAHSMVTQYFSPDQRRAMIAAVLRAGARATAERPLAWISLEWTRDRSEVQLRLTEWIGNGGEGTTTTLATCHPYGASVNWKA
jgi:hypothetical protein